MWLLHFLPDAFLAFVVNAVLIAGILATVLTCFLLKHLIRFVPTLAPHIKIAQIASIVVLLSGVYFKGGYSAEMAWRERVAEVEAKVAKAQAESKEANDKIDTKGKERVRVIREQALVVKQYIDREVVKYDTKFLPGGICEIPKEVIKAHNAAAKNEELK